MAYLHLRTALQPLKGKGFDTDPWTPAKFTELKVNVDTFLDLLKWFSSHENEIVNAALAHAIGRPVGWAAVDTCTLKQMYSCLSWLNNENDGKRFLGKASRELLVDKMRKDGQSLEEAAMLYAFNEQLKERKDMERLYLSRPERLSGAYKFKELEKEFEPAVSYRGPDESKLSELCVDLHISKEPGVELTRELIKHCKIAYKSEAEMNHKVEFLKDATMKKHLVKWIVGKVVDLGDKEGPFDELNTFVACAEAIGVDMDSRILDLLTKGPSRKRKASSSGT